MLNKKVEDITFDDVEAFCKRQIAENSWIDYKASFSHTKPNEQIAKVVSALANTHGGWVIFGIKEKKQAGSAKGLPDALEGIDAAGAPEDKVMQVCLNRIHPPVVPEMQWCPLPSDPTKGILVCRVYESDSTPHEIEAGEVRIRVNDMSILANDEGGKLASVSEIEMLLNRRQKSTDLKKRILERANERGSLMNGSTELRVYCVPHYPTGPIVDWKQLRTIAGASHRFKAFSAARTFKPAHESLIDKAQRSAPDNKRQAISMEFGIHGLIHIKTEVWEMVKSDIYVNANLCFELMDSVIGAAEFFYNQAGFNGLVEVGVGLDMRSANYPIQIDQYGTRIQMSDRRFEFAKQVLCHQLPEDDVLKDLYTEFMWACGDGKIIDEDLTKDIEYIRRSAVRR